MLDKIVTVPNKVDAVPSEVVDVPNKIVAVPSKIVVVSSDKFELAFDISDIAFMGSFVEDLIELCDDDVLTVSVPFSKDDLLFFYNDYTSKRYSFICTAMGAFFNNGIDYLNNILDFTNLWNCGTSVSNSSVYKMFNEFCDSDEHCNDTRDYVEDRHNCSFGESSIEIHDEDDERCFYVQDAQCNVIMHIGRELSIYPRKKVNNNRKFDYRLGDFIDTSGESVKIYNYSDNYLVYLYESGRFVYYDGDKIYYLTFVELEILATTYTDATRMVLTDLIANTHATHISNSIISNIRKCEFDSCEVKHYLLTMIPNMHIFKLPNDCDVIRIY